MTDISDIKSLIEAQGGAFDEFKRAQTMRVDQLETRLNRPGAMIQTPEGQGVVETLRSTTGQEHRLYAKGQPFASAYRGSMDDFSLGMYARQAVCGSEKAMGSGPALVPTWLAGNVIDDVRAASVVAEAGARFMGIDGPTIFARINGDPTVYQHTENTDDVVESVADVSPITVDPKMLMAIVPLSEELVADSPNIDAVIRQSIAAAFASKLDALGIAKLLADANIPKSAVAHNPAVWLKVLEAVGVAMAAKQRLPSAHIGGAGDFIARASQLASTAGSWLGRPPVLARMLELPTSAMADGTAIFGDFNHAVMIAGRSELRVEIVRWAKSTKGQHAMIAHMRMDAYVVQPKALFKQLAVIV